MAFPPRWLVARNRGEPTGTIAVPALSRWVARRGAGVQSGLFYGGATYTPVPRAGAARRARPRRPGGRGGAEHAPARPRARRRGHVAVRLRLVQAGPDRGRGRAGVPGDAADRAGAGAVAGPHPPARR